MKINITINIYTDGDYGIAYDEETGGAFYNDYELGENNRFAFINDYDNSQTYTLLATFDNENAFTCKYEAQDFLSKVFCNIRVGYKHWYIIEYIYKMFDRAMTHIGCWSDGTFEMSGNYEGTYIEVEIEE